MLFNKVRRKIPEGCGKICVLPIFKIKIDVHKSTSHYKKVRSETFVIKNNFGFLYSPQWSQYFAENKEVLVLYGIYLCMAVDRKI